MEVSMARARKAVAAVGLIFAVAALGSALENALGKGEAPELHFSGRALARQLMAEEPAFSVLGAIPEDGRASSAAMPAGVVREWREAPAWVEQEIASLEEASELRATDDWSLIGFTLTGSAEQAREWMECQLKERGWALVESGSALAATAVKEGGDCPWLLFSCTEAGGATCVVVQVLMR